MRRAERQLDLARCGCDLVEAKTAHLEAVAEAKKLGVEG
jgi:hypothetical protein